MSESEFIDSPGGIVLISAAVTIGVPALCIVMLCLVFVCIVKLIHRSKHFASSQNLVGTERQPKQTELEGAEFKAQDPTLSEVPPPSYEHIDEYKNVDFENDGVVRTQFKFSLSTNNGTSSPPDYDSLEMNIVHSRSINAYNNIIHT